MDHSWESGSQPSSHRPPRPRPAAGGGPAHQVLALQRAAGNRATTVAVQRFWKKKAPPGIAPVTDLPAYSPGWFTDKERAYRFAQGSSPFGSGLSSDIGSPLSQAGKSDKITGLEGPTVEAKHYGVNAGGTPELADAGAGMGIAGTAFGGLGDLLTITGKGGELHGARLDAKVAKHSGSSFWDRAARRQVRIKGADVGVAATKLVTGDFAKIAGGGVSLAKTAGDIGGQAAAVGGVVTGAAALPIQLVSVIRDFRKLVKQGFRLHRMRKRLNAHDELPNVKDAQRLVGDTAVEALRTREVVRLGERQLSDIEADMGRWAQQRQALLDEARAGDPSEWRRISGQVRLLDDRLGTAREELEEVRRDLTTHRQELLAAQQDETKALRAWEQMRGGVETMADEARDLDGGKPPSLRALAHYARIKSAKGVTRRTVKVVAGALGVAAGVCAIVALCSGPGAIVAGPLGVALGAAGALLGLGLAAETGWRFLSKRWDRTEGAYVEKVDSSGKKTYDKIEGLGQRLKHTLFWRTKLFNAPDANGVAKERKSHRKQMAEALWDYATNKKYERVVRDEAWDIIRDLTGRERSEIWPTDKDPQSLEPTEKKLLDGQRAAALKLFEDKLKSA